MQLSRVRLSDKGHILHTAKPASPSLKPLNVIWRDAIISGSRVRVNSIFDPQQVFPLAKFALKAHALGEARGGSASIAGKLMRQGPRPAASKKISGQPASAEVRAAIQKNYDQLHEAYAKKDLHAIKALYAPDFVARDGTIVMNAETSFSTKEMLFAMVSPTITFDIKDVIMTAPDTAVVTVKSEENVGFMYVTETARATWKHIGGKKGGYRPRCTLGGFCADSIRTPSRVLNSATIFLGFFPLP